MRNLVVVLAAVTLLAACSGGMDDPAFLSVGVGPSSEPCDAGRLCVEVQAEVDGTREGRGSCEIFGPGDPGNLEPLAANSDINMQPRETVVWQVDVSDDDYNVSDLNPVCFPMSEG